VNQLQDRLKDAYAAAAGTVGPENIRQLDEQSAVITWPTAKPQRSTRRWAMPLAIAATALAVIAATALPQYLTSRSGNVPASSLGEHFVSALAPGKNLVILKLSTGAKTATVTPPSPLDSFKAAATGNGVRYVVAVARQGRCGTSLYQFRLNSAGKPSRLTPFDGGHVHQKVNQLQLSADGRVFGYLAHRCGTAGADLNIVNLKSGQHRQWTVPGKASISQLSLSGDGGRLTFGASQPDGSDTAVYLLDTASAQGPVVQRSRILVRGAQFGNGEKVEQPRISLNGRIVYFTSDSGSLAHAATQVRSINVRTGHLKVLASTLGAFFTLDADPSVHRAISIIRADLLNPYALVINLRTGRFAKLKPSFYVPDNGTYVW
jgi:hypothetical protein